MKMRLITETYYIPYSHNGLVDKYIVASWFKVGVFRTYHGVKVILK